MVLFSPLFGFFSPRTSGYEAQKEPQLTKKLPITNFKSQTQIASEIFKMINIVIFFESGKPRRFFGYDNCTTTCYAFFNTKHFALMNEISDFCSQIALIYIKTLFIIHYSTIINQEVCI